MISPPPDYILVPDDADTYLVVRYPWAGLVEACLYLLLIKFILPRYMEKRQPYKLNNIIRIYNLFQVAVCAHLLYKFVTHETMARDYRKHYCHYYHVEDNPTYIEVFHLSHIYLYLKSLDLLDTIFMTLKKRQNQLTFLHLFHHTVMVTISPILVGERDGLAFVSALVNSFIHVIMYSYYFLASYQELKRPLRMFKPWVTRLQLVQFVFCVLLLCYNKISGCSMSPKLDIIWPTVGGMFIYLFSKFYYETYILKKKKSN